VLVSSTDCKEGLRRLAHTKTPISNSEWRKSRRWGTLQGYICNFGCSFPPWIFRKITSEQTCRRLNQVKIIDGICVAIIKLKITKIIYVFMYLYYKWHNLGNSCTRNLPKTLKSRANLTCHDMKLLDHGHSWYGEIHIGAHRDWSSLLNIQSDWQGLRSVGKIHCVPRFTHQGADKITVKSLSPCIYNAAFKI